MAQNSPDNNSDTYCLFRHRLNRDCQLKILEYLNITDLLEFSKLGDYYKELSGYTVGQKLVHVNLEHTSEILDVLGKSVKKIKCIAFGPYGSGLILKTIINKCTPDIIREIQIEINEPGRFYWNIEHTVSVQQLALFSNLKTLSIYHDYASKDTRASVHLMNKMVSVALNLKVLKWNYNGTKCKWLRTGNLNDLCKMYVERQWHCITIDELKRLIQTLPKLEAFNFAGKADPDVAESIGTYLSEHCKTLKEFVFENSDSRDLLTTPNKVYSFLTSLPNLNVVSLAWSTLDDHPLMSFISQQHGRIKKLVFAFYFDIIENDIIEKEQLWQLRYSADSATLEISRIVFRKTFYEMNFEWFLENNINIVQHLPSVIEITLGASPFVNVHKLLQRTPNIETLSISRTPFRHLPVEIRRIVHTFEERYQDKGCHLILSLEQFREFEVYNKKNVLSTTIDTKYYRTI